MLLKIKTNVTLRYIMRRTAELKLVLHINGQLYALYI